MSSEFGGSWWGERWIQSLEQLSTAWQNRLPRGRDYARKGHVIELSVSNGKIAARVQGSRSKPYVTTIEVPTLRESNWDLVIATLASEARFPAQLLIGVMPSDIDDAFAEHSVNLFPVRNSEMLGSCTCPDKARPCKHIAAVHYAFGQALDRDPFLLFQLRGADRERLLLGFSKAWFGDSFDEESLAQQDGGEDGVPIAPLSADQFNRAPAQVESMSFTPLAGDADLLILDRLGAPRAWTLPIPIESLLGPVYTDVAALGRNIAVGGFDATESAERESEETPTEGLTNDGFTALTMGGPDDEDDEETLSSGPRATFVLPKSLSVQKRISRQPSKPAEEPAKPAAPTILRRTKPARARRRADAPAPKKEVAPKTQPTTTPPSDFVDHDSVPAAPVVVRRRGETPVVRRRGKTIVENPGISKAEELENDASDLFTEAKYAFKGEEYTNTLRLATRLWAIRADLQAFLFLMASAVKLDRSTEMLRSEAARIMMRGRERNFSINPALAVLLLCAGESKLVADQVFSLGKKAWRDEGPAEILFTFACFALAGGARVPDSSHLVSLWDPLDEMAGEVDGAGSAGEWIRWALVHQPPAPTLHERLTRVMKELSMWALGAANAAGGPEAAARYACAAAETLQLAKIDGGARPFLGMAKKSFKKKKRISEALEAAIAASPLLS